MKKLFSVLTVTAFSIGMMAPFATPAHAKAALPTLQEVLETAEKEGFCYTYSGRDRVFDGTRIVSGTAQDMERLKNSNKGTLLIRYKTNSDTNQAIFAAGSGNQKDEYGAVLLNGVSSVDQVRVDFPDGMSANLSDTVVADGDWHTFVYSVDASDPSNKSAKTVTSFDGSKETQYPDYTSWYNSNENINNLNYLTIGGTKDTLENSGDHKNFIGELAFAAFVPTTFTQEEAAALSAEPWGETDQSTKVFFNGDATGSKFFRIPFLLHTVDGSLIAGCDANFGSTGDSAENIDAVIRRKADAEKYSGAEGWSDAVVPYALHMQDYADETGYKQFSSSVIDGVIVQDQKSPTNRILLVIDAFAWNGGVFQQLNIDNDGQAHGGQNRDIAYGDGFCTIDGKKYLLLSSKNIKQNGINMNIDRSQFDYAVDIYGEKNSDGRYNIYHLVGTPNPYSSNGTNVDDSNLSLGELSAYSLSSEYELYKDGELLQVQQRTKDTGAEPVMVPAKIFYEDSELQMYNTSYLLQVYSDDDGKTWHSGNIISGMVKRENSRYYITGPGSGLQIQNGEYEGRILIPIYYQGKSSTEVIYTDDGGKTWQHGEPIPSQLALHESALVEMPDGSLQIFVRNTTGSGGKLITARSYDGGETWTEVGSLFGDNERGTNCQISAINYSKEVRSAKDGKEYPAVLLATTSSKARTNGHIYVGLVKPSGDGYAIDWEYDYTLTGQNELFAYSCMAELSNGKVGILYETSENNSWSTGLQQMYYKELTMDELTAHTFS